MVELVHWSFGKKDSSRLLVVVINWGRATIRVHPMVVVQH